MIVQERITNNQTEIIVLCHNALKVTKKFLQLLFANTKDFDLILIDNGSSDSTPSFLKDSAAPHKNITLILNKDNKGVIGGRNQGWDVSSSLSKKPKYIQFLDNDQFVAPGWLDQHVAVLERGYDMIGVEAWQMNNHFFPIHKNTKLTEWFCYVGCGGMLLKREVPEKIGMFDDRFNRAYFEDPDLAFRALKEGLSIGWNFRAKLTHLGHQTLLNIADKNQQFINSYQRFKAKWHDHSIVRLYQMNLPEFSV